MKKAPEIIGTITRYVGHEFPHLRDRDIKIVVVLKNLAKLGVSYDSEDFDMVHTDEGIVKAGGVTADDCIEVQPWMDDEKRFSWISSDPVATDLACFPDVHENSAQKARQLRRIASKRMMLIAAGFDKNKAMEEAAKVLAAARTLEEVHGLPPQTKDGKEPKEPAVTEEPVPIATEHGFRWGNVEVMRLSGFRDGARTIFIRTQRCNLKAKISPTGLIESEMNERDRALKSDDKP